MNLRDLEYFVALAETGHFGRAAEQCFCTQSTLSGQVRKLEQELGAPLFERGATRTQLTLLGEQTLPWARQALASTRKVQELGRAARDPLAGDFTLAAIPTIGPWLWPRALPVFQQRLPGMRILLREEQTRLLLSSLRNGTVDAGVLALPLEEHGLEFEELWEEDFVLAVPANHPLALHTRVEVNALEEAELLLLDEGHCFREQALDVCHAAGAREREGFRATSLETLRLLVRAGEGITLLPRSAAIPEAGMALIEFVPPMPRRKVGLAWRRDHAREKAVDHVGHALLHSRKS